MFPVHTLYGRDEKARFISYVNVIFYELIRAFLLWKPFNKLNKSSHKIFIS